MFLQDHSATEQNMARLRVQTGQKQVQENKPEQQNRTRQHLVESTATGLVCMNTGLG